MKIRNKGVFILLGILVLSGVFSLGMGPGRMGPGRMGPGMMRSSDVFVDSEYEFLVHMIPHHREAVDSAEFLKENTEREEMRDFAEEIIQTQSAEIEDMEGWLQAWYPDREHEVQYEPMMGDYENLSGEALDRTFLEDMIPHHMEAVMMSQQLLMRGLAEHEEMVALAQNIRDTQWEEIHRMEQWLAEWNGGSFWMFRDHGSRGMMGRTGRPTALLWIGIIVMVFAVLIVILFSRKGRNPEFKSFSDKTAKELLDIRFAKGEISEEEYLRMRKQLEE